MLASFLRAVDRVPGGRYAKHAVAAALDRTPVPYLTRLRMRRLGFKAEAFVLYELDRNDSALYLPDRCWADMAKVDGATVQALLGNKLLFHHTFREELPLPDVPASLALGRLVPNRGSERPIASFDDLLTYLDTVGPVMLKPIGGGKGRGIHRIEASHDGLRFDGRPTAVDDVATAISRLDGVLVSAFVRQAGYAAEIFAGSANTMRLIVMRDADSGEPFVPAAIHRFGRTATVPVDNYSRGGVFAGIDVETGELGRLFGYDAQAGRASWHDHHPDSGAPVRGVVVPGWHEVVDRLLDFTQRHPYFSYVGWDVVKTDTGMSILEANYGAGLQIQVVRPFLADPRIRRFVEKHGIFEPNGMPSEDRA